MTSDPTHALIGTYQSVRDPDPDEQPFDPDDEFSDPTTHRAVPRVAAALLVALVTAVAFTGGVLVQKHHDAHTTSAAGLPSFGAGGLPGFGTSTGSAGAAGTSTSSGPAVIGTIVAVHGSEVTVKDIGGKTHVVRTSNSTSLLHQSSTALSALTAGANVTVEGTTAGDGSVTATTVTTR